MLLYSFNADLREVLRRLATAAQNDDSQNGGCDEKGTMHELGRLSLRFCSLKTCALRGFAFGF